MKKIIAISFTFLLCFLILSLQISLINQAKNTLPNAICFRSQNGMNVSFDEMKTIKEATAVAQKNASIATAYNNNNEQVNLWYTNEFFFAVANLKCKYGSYFSGKSGTEQNRFIVVSDQLAIRYFKTDTVVGQSMLINNQIHTICGVYEEKQSLLNQLSQQNLSTVYLPYQSYMGKEPLLPQMIFVKSDSQFTKSAYNHVQNQVSSHFIYDSVTNYNDGLQLIAQTVHFSIAACGFMLMIWLVTITIKQGKQSYQLYRTNGLTRDFYKAVAYVGILVAIGIVIVCLTHFDFFMPADWTPKENIFDLHFYKEKMISIFQLKNSIMIYDSFWNYSYSSIFVCCVLSVVFFMSFRALLILSISTYRYYKLGKACK